MAQYTPDDTLLEVLDEGNEGDGQQTPEGALQGGEDDCGGAGNGQGSGHGGPSSPCERLWWNGWTRQCMQMQWHKRI